MNDLDTLRKMLDKVGTIRFDDWKLHSEYRPAVTTMSIGCPDTEGAFSTLMFDKDGQILEWRQYSRKHPGDMPEECRCPFCAQLAKPKCHCGEAPCVHDKPIGPMVP